MFCLTGRRFLGLMGDKRADGAGGGFPGGAAPKAPAVSAFLLVATGGPVLLEKNWGIMIIPVG